LPVLLNIVPEVPAIAGRWWLMLIILATWEAENVRITVPGQLRQKKVCKIPISTTTKWAMVACARHPSVSVSLK
jgi:hypothetical protein